MFQTTLLLLSFKYNRTCGTVLETATGRVVWHVPLLHGPDHYALQFVTQVEAGPCEGTVRDLPWADDVVADRSTRASDGTLSARLSVNRW